MSLNRVTQFIFFASLILWITPTAGQNVVYRVGSHETLMYTNLPHYSGTTETTYSIRSVPGDVTKNKRVSNTAVNLSAKRTDQVATPAWGEAIRINPKDQAQRDQGRRQILEDELIDAQRALSEAQNQRDQSKVARLEADIVALRREISLVR
jgi:hypothetical protein